MVGHTLQPTALVHEAWLKPGDQRFENRAHFFGTAAEAMRRILVDRARHKPTDLTPLAEAKTLTSLTLPPDAKDYEATKQ